MGITHLYHKIIFAILRKRIKKNPHLGQEEGEGTYLFKKGGYSISYRISKLSGGKLCVEWISQKRRLSAYDEKVKRIKKGFFDFWHYQKWLLFFRPPSIFILIAAILFFYFEAIETQEIKAKRIKWIIASATGISSQDIQYIDGWVEISGQRRRKVERINEPTRYVYEPVKYTFNPFNWLFSSEGGFIKIWRQDKGGYVTSPVAYNARGDVWLKKKDTWMHGQISGETIKWDTPQITGKTPGHEVTIEDKKIRIIDK